MNLNQEILKIENNLKKLENLHNSFDYLKINIASPNRIKSWAIRELPSGEKIGEITNSETLNFRTYQPEPNGLFCEKIFGPIKNWKCKCGKYGGIQINKICEECLVELTETRVRRYRMGYISLSIPIVHIWYLKGTPNYLCTLLKSIDDTLSTEDIEDIIYFRQGTSQDILNNTFFDFYNFQKSFKTIFNKYLIFSENLQKQRYGSEIIKAILDDLNLETEIKKIRKLIQPFIFKEVYKNLNIQKIFIQKLRILESFFATKTNPSWLVLTILPVLPPNLRPLLELENKQLISADINEIYRLIIIRNERLFEFIYKYFAPALLTFQGRKLLQETVDSLIDNSKLPKEKIFSLNNKNLKGLTDILDGKYGRFRQSLLGKRVDYSARSVIITNSTLRLNQCGLPFEIAKELFQPFLINKILTLINNFSPYNIKLAKAIISRKKPFIWLLLENLLKKNTILLNRAPTLHRAGIQSFNPVLILGQAIHLHPLVCAGFNADFDGDQMAVHLPLFQSSQLEAKTLMLPSFNILSPANGNILLKPAQDIVIGCYYLTLMIRSKKAKYLKLFYSEKDVLNSYYKKKITLHDNILIKYTIKNIKFKLKNKELYFSESLFEFFNKKINIKKIYKFNSNNDQFFIVTNIGVLTIQKNEKNKYLIQSIFIETTPGRIIFNQNFENIKKNDYNENNYKKNFRKFSI
jgi:DNA-directed RNA polymerase subunit beta'